MVEDDNFYSELSAAHSLTPNGDFPIVMKDFNTKARNDNTALKYVMGVHGFGDRNDKAE